MAETTAVPLSPEAAQRLRVRASYAAVAVGLILIAGHSARHTLQLEEVKANPNFPKQ